MTDSEFASESVEKVWAEFAECLQQIRKNTEEAHSLLCQLSQLGPAESPDGTQLSFYSTIPSSEPFLEDPETTIVPGGAGSPSWDRFPLQDFRVDTATCDLRAIWQAWKQGTPTVPSIEFMNSKFGPLAFTASAVERATLHGWGKLVDEIEYHLEAGRDLDEILAVAKLHLDRYNGSVSRLARRVLENMELKRATFFQLSSSSRGSM